jgi:hypothetical protein
MAKEFENFDDMENAARQAVDQWETTDPHALEDDTRAAGALVLPGFDFDTGDTYWNVLLGELDTKSNMYNRFVDPFVASSLDEALSIVRVTLTWLTEGRTPPQREQFEAQLREFVRQAEDQGLDREGAVKALVSLVDHEHEEA